MFITPRFYIAMTALILLIAAGFAVPPLFTLGRWLLLLFLLIAAADAALLWHRRAITVARTMAGRFSNGDANDVTLRIESSYPFAVQTETIDEIPFQFQRRDVLFRVHLPRREARTIRYQLTPTRRGVYSFGRIRVFVSTVIGLLQRRYTLGEPQDVKVYPSYLMLRQYELLAHSRHLTEMGIKRVRRVGHNTDFEQIKDYVVGDDFRTINWRATARRHLLMTNVYQEERSQQVYSVIDKGRMMQQSFGGMTLLDYAINATLVLSYVATHKEDRAGLVTFADQFGTFVPASRQSGQLQVLQEALYAEHTAFKETDFSALIAGLARHVTRRSLLILYTSFTSMTALRRQLPFLRQLGLRHRLLVVFFEDEQQRNYIREGIDGGSTTLEEDYRHVIAEKYAYEQRLIVHTLQQYGILALLTTPRQLSVGVINKYLTIKQ